MLQVYNTSGYVPTVTQVSKYSCVTLVYTCVFEVLNDWSFRKPHPAPDLTAGERSSSSETVDPLYPSHDEASHTVSGPIAVRIPGFNSRYGKLNVVR